MATYDLMEIIKKPSGHLFEVQWWGGMRAGIPVGWVPADGQILEYALFPDAAKVIQEGWVSSAPIPITTRSNWESTNVHRGFYAQWDADNFRVPDYNGKQPDALGAVFVRGDGKNSHPSGPGYMQGDAIRNITGRVYQTVNEATLWKPDMACEGAFDKVDGGQVNATATAGGYPNCVKQLLFNASRVVPTAEENRPVAATGCWIIRLFGAVTNAGSADAAALATAYANLASELDTLRRSVETIYLIPNNYPAGAPSVAGYREVISTGIPDLIGANARYVTPNPFGVGVPCAAEAEVYHQGEWHVMGWDGNSGTGANTYGTRASCINEGVVITTGKIGIGLSDGRYTGASTPAVEGGTALVNLPCRVRLTRLGGNV